MAKIIIRWKGLILGAACKFDVYLMNTYIGELRCGGALEIPVNVGKHMLFFKQNNLRMFKKIETSFEAVVNSKTEIVELRTKIDMNGNLAVNYADNAPHIPTYDSPAINSAAASTVNTPNDTHKCLLAAKVTETRKSSNKLAACLIVTAICIVGIVSCSLHNVSDSKTIPTTTAAQNTEMTDEEKAQSELEKATAKFSDGNYRSALEICDNIKTQYPDTAVAADMSNYIDEQYKQYPHFTANQLMAEYASNIVNADKEYTGKTVIVSGIISNFDKTNHDKNLCVLLKSGDYLFKAVQLNFNTSQTEAVAALNAGSNVKVIGKCTGKSGKQLIFFDGENVMIEDCIIID